MSVLTIHLVGDGGLCCFLLHKPVSVSYFLVGIEITDLCFSIWLYMGSGKSHSDLHTCTANT